MATLFTFGGLCVTGYAVFHFNGVIRASRKTVSLKYCAIAAGVFFVFLGLMFLIDAPKFIGKTNQEVLKFKHTAREECRNLTSKGEFARAEKVLRNSTGYKDVAVRERKKLPSTFAHRISPLANFILFSMFGIMSSVLPFLVFMVFMHPKVGLKRFSMDPLEWGITIPVLNTVTASTAAVVIAFYLWVDPKRGEDCLHYSGHWVMYMLTTLAFALAMAHFYDAYLAYGTYRLFFGYGAWAAIYQALAFSVLKDTQTYYHDSKEASAGIKVSGSLAFLLCGVFFLAAKATGVNWDGTPPKTFTEHELKHELEKEASAFKEKIEKLELEKDELMVSTQKDEKTMAEGSATIQEIIKGEEDFQRYVQRLSGSGDAEGQLAMDINKRYNVEMEKLKTISKERLNQTLSNLKQTHSESNPKGLAHLLEKAQESEANHLRQSQHKLRKRFKGEFEIQRQTLREILTQEQERWQKAVTSGERKLAQQIERLNSEKKDVELKLLDSNTTDRDQLQRQVRELEAQLAKETEQSETLKREIQKFEQAQKSWRDTKDLIEQKDDPVADVPEAPPIELPSFIPDAPPLGDPVVEAAPIVVLTRKKSQAPSKKSAPVPAPAVDLMADLRARLSKRRGDVAQEEDKSDDDWT